jgi:hypothetical protein
MVAQTNPTTEYTGVIASVNDKGVKLQGEADWRNFSKWADIATLPERGERVVLALDKSGYIRSVERIAGATVPEHNGRPNLQPVTRADAQRPAGLALTDRDLTAIRQAAVTAAIAVLGAGPGFQAPVDAVLETAAMIEQWIIRN